MLQTKPKCYLNYHKWTNTVSLSVYYEHFMLVGIIGSTGWKVHELEHVSNDDVEIPFEAAKILSYLVDPENPLSGDEEEAKKNEDWCFVTYPTPLYGPWEWISRLMPYEAFLNAREAGFYQHSNFFVTIKSGYEEAKKIYEEVRYNIKDNES